MSELNYVDAATLIGELDGFKTWGEKIAHLQSAFARPLDAKRDAGEAVIEAARKAFGDFSCRHAHQMDCGSFCHLSRAVAAYDAALAAPTETKTKDGGER